MGLHTILLDPMNAKRMSIAISAAGAFRTDDGGATWKPINRTNRRTHRSPMRLHTASNRSLSFGPWQEDNSEKHLG